MGGSPCSDLRPLSSSSSCSLVAPYVANINSQIAGYVQYNDFYAYSSTGSAMTTVSSFIRNETGDNFHGSRMMAVHWNRVAEYNGSYVSLARVYNQRRSVKHSLYSSTNDYIIHT